MGVWGIEPPFLMYFLKNESSELTFSRGMSAVANAFIRSSISCFFASAAVWVDERVSCVLLFWVFSWLFTLKICFWLLQWLSTVDLCFQSTEILQ